METLPVRYISTQRKLLIGQPNTGNQTNTSVWTCIEPAIAITTASLAHLRPLIPWAREHWSTFHEKGLLNVTSRATSGGKTATLGKCNHLPPNLLPDYGEPYLM